MKPGMKIWLAAMLCTWTLTAAAQQPNNELYFSVAAYVAGRDIKPDGPEVKQAAKYLRGISVAYSVSEADVAQTAGAALNQLRSRVSQANLFDMLDAAERIAPTEHTHDRGALVHALTLYVAARGGTDHSHEGAVKAVMNANKGVTK
ncbi:MAG: hypothetical protein JWN73_3631 [Betaproteobacteria bacterium]|nr:hypothetical protein [Betaproteobacteria bacterium]